MEDWLLGKSCVLLERQESIDSCGNSIPREPNCVTLSITSEAIKVNLEGVLIGKPGFSTIIQWPNSRNHSLFHLISLSNCPAKSFFQLLFQLKDQQEMGFKDGNVNIFVSNARHKA